MTAEDNFYSYFGELNRLIGERLNRLSVRDESLLSGHDITAMGLDSSDAPFITELLETMNLDISVSGSICSCLSACVP